MMSFLSSVILSTTPSTPPPPPLQPPDYITILFLDYDLIISMTSYPGNTLHPLHPCAVLSNYYFNRPSYFNFPKFVIMFKYRSGVTQE